MLNKMIDKTNKATKGLGIPNIPKASEKALKRTRVINRVTGASLLVVGAFLENKWIAGIAASTLVVNEIAHRKKK